ncbi:hypothetical protein [Chitinophaga arvensicola]|uniref:Cro/C1-type HTH DNA-binding domain-containing protein n=1 Tax=Chitinophaga arvensicola TaxID=29529 RepID=A0A1I0QJE5_9BACT|nr:hypothetical protein [Chitinophaga arvensicola]SEW27304.1 hypothetical protein SAMN04488122_1518 [Chitinophaga arvensicola]
MAKDKRYNAIKELIERGGITDFNKIFDIMPPSTMARHLGINYNNFTKRQADCSRFTVKEIMKMAELIGVEDTLIASLLIKATKAQYNKKARSIKG